MMRSKGLPPPCSHTAEETTNDFFFALRGCDCVADVADLAPVLQKFLI